LNQTLSELWENNDNAAVAYAPKKYPGKVIHFIPLKQYTRYSDPKIGWMPLAGRGVEVHQLQTFPAGMLAEPFVKELAHKLTECIEKSLLER
jgi:hypothetical protein